MSAACPLDNVEPALAMLKVLLKHNPKEYDRCAAFAAAKLRTSSDPISTLRSWEKGEGSTTTAGNRRSLLLFEQCDRFRKEISLKEQAVPLALYYRKKLKGPSLALAKVIVTSLEKKQELSHCRHILDFAEIPDVVWDVIFPCFLMERPPAAKVFLSRRFPDLEQRTRGEMRSNIHTAAIALRGAILHKCHRILVERGTNTNNQEAKSEETEKELQFIRRTVDRVLKDISSLRRVSSVSSTVKEHANITFATNAVEKWVTLAVERKLWTQKDRDRWRDVIRSFGSPKTLSPALPKSTSPQSTTHPPPSSFSIDAVREWGVKMLADDTDHFQNGRVDCVSADMATLIARFRADTGIVLRPRITSGLSLEGDVILWALANASNSAASTEFLLNWITSEEIDVLRSMPTPPTREDPMVWREDPPEASTSDTNTVGEARFAKTMWDTTLLNLLPSIGPMAYSPLAQQAVLEKRMKQFSKFLPIHRRRGTATAFAFEDSRLDPMLESDPDFKWLVQPGYYDKKEKFASRLRLTFDWHSPKSENKAHFVFLAPNDLTLWNMKIDAHDLSITRLSKSSIKPTPLVPFAQHRPVMNVKSILCDESKKPKQDTVMTARNEAIPLSSYGRGDSQSAAAAASATASLRLAVEPVFSRGAMVGFRNASRIRLLNSTILGQMFK